MFKTISNIENSDIFICDKDLLKEKNPLKKKLIEGVKLIISSHRKDKSSDKSLVYSVASFVIEMVNTNNTKRTRYALKQFIIREIEKLDSHVDCFGFQKKHDLLSIDNRMASRDEKECLKKGFSFALKNLDYVKQGEPEERVMLYNGRHIEFSRSEKDLYSRFLGNLSYQFMRTPFLEKAGAFTKFAEYELGNILSFISFDDLQRVSVTCKYFNRFENISPILKSQGLPFLCIDNDKSYFSHLYKNPIAFHNLATQSENGSLISSSEKLFRHKGVDVKQVQACQKYNGTSDIALPKVSKSVSGGVSVFFDSQKKLKAVSGIVINTVILPANKTVLKVFHTREHYCVQFRDGTFAIKPFVDIDHFDYKEQKRYESSLRTLKIESLEPINRRFVTINERNLMSLPGSKSLPSKAKFLVATPGYFFGITEDGQEFAIFPQLNNLDVSTKNNILKNGTFSENGMTKLTSYLPSPDKGPLPIKLRYDAQSIIKEYADNTISTKSVNTLTESLPHQLVGEKIRDIYPSDRTTAVVLEDGRVFEWGYGLTPGFKINVPIEPGVTKILSCCYQRTAILGDGRLYHWGNAGSGIVPITEGVTYGEIYSTQDSFATIQSDSRLRFWGNMYNVDAIFLDEVRATQLVSSNNSFAAIMENRTVFSWEVGKDPVILPGINAASGLFSSKDSFLTTIGKKRCYVWSESAPELQIHGMDYNFDIEIQSVISSKYERGFLVTLVDGSVLNITTEGMRTILDAAKEGPVDFET
ncbi:hypothetical protein HOG98_03880 [bacterium]|jgi:hypothetical protein|nr:hypothetical protein [bacterium]